MLKNSFSIIGNNKGNINCGLFSDCQKDFANLIISCYIKLVKNFRIKNVPISKTLSLSRSNLSDIKVPNQHVIIVETRKMLKGMINNDIKMYPIIFIFFYT